MFTTVHRNAPLFADVFNAMFNNDWMEPARKMNAAMPAMNISENDDLYKLEMAVPGLQKSDFDIKLDNEGNLVISAGKKELAANVEAEEASNNADNNNEAEEAKEIEDVKPVKYFRHEFNTAKFNQTFTLPEDVELNEIKANVADGVLTIDLPKKKPVPPVDNTRLIEVM